MSRLGWLFSFFVFGALVDLGGTVWNLYFIGYGFEGNPLISNWWSAVLVKSLSVFLVCIIVFSQFHQRYDKKKCKTVETGVYWKYSIVSLLLIAGLIQILAGVMHLYVYTQYHAADELIITGRGDVLVMQDGSVVEELRPIVERTKKLEYYAWIIGLLILYPYLMGLLTFRLLWWVLNKKPL